MSQTGIGVMINALAGNYSGEHLEAAKGRTITGAMIDPEANNGDGALVLDFDDGAGLTIRDAGRSCCEARYLHTDDDLASIVGATLLGVEQREGPEETDEWGEPHEQSFVLLQTSKGVVTVVTHNEHNGYYGGFWLVAEFEGSVE